MEMEDVYFFDGFWWANIVDLRFGPYSSKADGAKMMRQYQERIDMQNRVEKKEKS